MQRFQTSVCSWSWRGHCKSMSLLPTFLGQINSEMVQLSHFLLVPWPHCGNSDAASTWHGSLLCRLCWPLFGKCADLTSVLIFEQPGLSEVFQNLGSFKRSHLPSVSCSVFQHFLFSLLHHWPGTHSKWTVSPCLWDNKKNLHRWFYSPPRTAIRSPPTHTKMERNEWHGGWWLLSKSWM